MNKRLGAVLMVAAVAVLPACSSGSSPDPAATRADAQRACKDWVTDKLKSPATAKFSDVSAITPDDIAALGSGSAVATPAITGTGSDYSVVVTGSVDSENGFGALIRSTWLCTATLKGDEWRGSATVIDGNDS